MSNYLITRIEASPRITVHLESQIARMDGARYLEQVTLSTPKGEHLIKTGNVFLMLGAIPNSEWVRDCLELDEKGFIICPRPQAPFETSRPGVYAVGDVRAGSVKRVASAVGEGSVVISSVYAYLAGLR